jgi:GTP-binding protein
MLIHEIDVTFEGGHGGAGKVSFFHNQKGPDGGDGGKGADLSIQTTSDLTVLNQFSHKKYIKAQDGQAGQSNKKSGPKGADTTLLLPIGSELTDKETGETIALNQVNETILLCKGGLGGRGNAALRSSSNTTPMYAQKGLRGKLRQFHINLRFLADIGFIGLPNVGKSSLLNALTNAKAKVANYPFTTLEANLGVMEGKIIADIPGLIEGAASGKGLGVKFLKHVEKVTLLVHCVSLESESLAEDYKVVRGELEQYNPTLLDKEEIILITKTDLYNEDVLAKKIKPLKKLHRDILTVSINHPGDIAELKNKLQKFR